MAKDTRKCAKKDTLKPQNFEDGRSMVNNSLFASLYPPLEGQILEVLTEIGTCSQLHKNDQTYMYKLIQQSNMVTLSCPMKKKSKFELEQKKFSGLYNKHV